MTEAAATGRASSSPPQLAPGTSADLADVARRFPLVAGAIIAPGDWIGRHIDFGALPWRLVPLWQRRDAEAEADAIAFWARHGLLGDGVDPEERAAELVALAYSGDELAGVATAAIAGVEFLPHSLFAFYRNAVAPAHRRAHLGQLLTAYGRSQVERWSRENPSARVHGLAALIHPADFNAHHAKPVWPVANLNLVARLVGGAQLRVAWFDHARLGPVAV